MSDIATPDSSDTPNRREDRRDLLILLLILLFGFSCLLITAQIAAQPIDSWRIETSMRSEFNPDTDYEVTVVTFEPILPEVMTIPAWDPRNPLGSNNGEATVIPPAVFEPAPTSTPENIAGTTATPTVRPTAPTQPTATTRPSATPTLSPTPSATSTRTPFPTPTATPTATPPPPTSTPRPTETPSPTSTSTPVPTATPTPLPTSTSTSLPTATPTETATLLPPGLTRTPPGLTRQPTWMPNPGKNESLGGGQSGMELPLSLVLGSVGLFFSVQAVSWHVNRRRKGLLAPKDDPDHSAQLITP